MAFDPRFSGDEAAHWSIALREFVRRALDRSTVAPFRLESRVRKGHRALEMESFSFRTTDDVTINATLLRPRSSTPIGGTIIIVPGRNALHAQVIGAEPPDHPDRNIAERLADLQFATLTLDHGLIGAIDYSKVGARDETSLIAHVLALQGEAPLAHLSADLVSVLAWLEQEPWCSSERLGLLGHSLGGHAVLHAALAYARRLPLVLASCLSTYSVLFGRDAVAGGATALPSIMRRADLPDLIAALAPAPLQIQHGELDRQFPPDVARAAADVIEASYDRLGARALLDIAFLPMGHGTDAARAAAFFKEAFIRNGTLPASPVLPARVHFDAAVRVEAIERIDQSLFAGALTLGPVTAEFEASARRWTGTAHVAAVNSGTSAIEAALRVVGVSGRRVLIPANTFFATASAALAAGADIDFVDTEAEGLGMDPAALAEALVHHDDVAAVVVVHIGGLISPRVLEIAALCERHDVVLIEDAAHALGSTLEGQLAGSFGRLGCFSLYPTKIITSAEGGLVASRDKPDDALVRRLRDHGKTDVSINAHDYIGGNWRMSEIHAAIGLAHLKCLGKFIEERRAAAAFYDAALATVPGVRAVREPASARSNYYKYVVMLDPGIDRTALKDRLRNRHGVNLSGEIYHQLCSQQPALGGRFAANATPTAFDFSRRHICLPIFQGLTQSVQQRVIDALSKELAALRKSRGSFDLAEKQPCVHTS